MIQLIRCAGMLACLMSAGCGWLAVRDQDPPRPAKAQQPPARAEQPPRPGGSEPRDADPFAVPTPQKDPRPKTLEPVAPPHLPLEAERAFSPADIPGATLDSPAMAWSEAPLSQACPCPRCREARHCWWHRFWPWGRDEDCDGLHAAPCERFIEAHEKAMQRVPLAGTLLYAALDTQIANGDAAQMMLYDYDFLPGSAVLSTRGRRQVRQLLQRLLSVPAPLLIQATPGQPQLAIARRAAVLAELEQMGAAVPAELVQISEPLARGLGGLDAALIHNRVLEQQAGGAAGAGIPATPVPTIGPPAGP